MTPPVDDRRHVIAGLVVLALLVVGSVSTLVYAVWPRDTMALTPEQKHEADCQFEHDAALIDLGGVLHHLARGEDTDLDRGLFIGREWAALSLCFVRSTIRPDNTPINLLLGLNDLTTPAEWIALRRALDEGWTRSEVGGVWQGPTR
jgi:hypothetical protein